MLIGVYLGKKRCKKLALSQISLLTLSVIEGEVALGMFLLLNIFSNIILLRFSGFCNFVARAALVFAFSKE